MGSSASDFDEPCHRCGRRKCDGARDPWCLTPAEAKEAAVARRIEDLERQNGALRSSLEKFIDNKGCMLDSEGYCRMHIQVERKHRKPCAVRHARELMEGHPAPDLKAENARLELRNQEWARAIRNVQRAIERNGNRELNMGDAWALTKEAVAFELTK